MKWKWFVAPYVWYRKSQFVVEFWRLKNSKRSDGPKKDFDDPVGQFVVEFWRLKSRKRSDDPWQEKSYGWDYDANRGESMPIMLWRCSEHLARSGMVGNVCHLLYDLLYVGNVCHLLYEYWRNLQRQFVLTLLNNQYSIVHPRFSRFHRFLIIPPTIQTNISQYAVKKKTSRQDPQCTLTGNKRSSVLWWLNKSFTL